MKHPRLTIGLGALGATFLGLWLTRKDPPPLPAVNPLSVSPSAGPVKLTAHLSDGFFRQVLQLASDYDAKGAGISAEDVLAVLNAESGISPTAMNAGSKCAGMNQICNLSGVGWTGSREDYLALSAEQQFPWVRKFWDSVIGSRYGLLTDMGKMYLLNFNPGNLGKPEDFVLYDKATGGDSYRLNQASLDPGKKGTITVADMTIYVKRAINNNGPLATKTTPALAYWAELRMRLNALRGGNV